MYSPILLIAKKEIKDNIRNRWLVMNTLLLLILSLCILLAGSAISGELVLPNIDNIISGLVTLSVFILPLSAVLLSYDSFVGEEESGTLLLMLTYPIKRHQFLLGKLLGHSLLITLACLIGFTPSLLLLSYFSKLPTVIVITHFANFMLSAMMLAITFTIIGYMVSLQVKEKAKALGILLLVWFVIVLIYDLALLASIVALADILPRNVLNLFILLNPADLFRAINLSILNNNGQVTDSAINIMSNTNLNLSILYMIMFVWLFTLFFSCNFLFNRKKF